MAVFDSSGNGGFVPGQILLRNINLGLDTNDYRFQLLKNVDSGGLEFRCRKDFGDTSFNINFNGNSNPIPLFFGLSYQNPDLFYPVVFSFTEPCAFLLEPYNVDHLFSGGACADLCWEESIRSNLSLRRSATFYNGHIQKMPDERYTPRNKYEMVVHHSSNIPQLTIETPCAALIYKLERHYNHGRPQSYRHIDTNLLGFYSDNEIYQENLRLLTDLKSEKIQGDFWWNYIDKLSDPRSFFERLTSQVHLVEKSVKQGRINLPKAQISRQESPAAKSTTTHFSNIHYYEQIAEARKRLLIEKAHSNLLN